MTIFIDRAWFQRELHRGNPGDTEFYARVMRGARTCLEVGAGLGRLSLPLGPLAERYVALDLDPTLLEWTRASDGRGIESVVGDMRDFDVEGTFDRILLPYNVLFCAGGLDGARAALACARRHLAADGEIWLDVYRLEDFHEALTNDELPSDDGVAEVVYRAPTEDGELVVLERTIADPERQRLEVRYQALLGPRVVGLETQIHHYLLEEQLLGLARECDLEVVGLFGDFDGNPLEEESEHVVVGFVRASPTNAQA